MSRHFHWSDLRGLNQLVNTATVGITDLVEAMHETILGTPGVLEQGRHGERAESPGSSTAPCAESPAWSASRWTRCCTSSRPAGTNSAARTPEGLAIVAALNGVIGDHLVASANPLAITMSVTHGGDRVALDARALATPFPASPARVVVLVHGLCMNDLQWTRNGHDHGAALARDLGCLPLYLRYNTGRHISTNGHEFAYLLELMWSSWPEPKTTARHRWPQHGGADRAQRVPPGNGSGPPVAHASRHADLPRHAAPGSAARACRTALRRRAGIEPLHRAVSTHRSRSQRRNTRSGPWLRPRRGLAIRGQPGQASPGFPCRCPQAFVAMPSRQAGSDGLAILHARIVATGSSRWPVPLDSIAISRIGLRFPRATRIVHGPATSTC